MKQKNTEIGMFTNDVQDLRDAVPAFLNLYNQRPSPENPGGMGITHMFLTWYLLQRIKPTYIIESGIWRGQGTWLLEHAYPQAELHCIDPVMKPTIYRSKKATYYKTDFEKIDWSFIEDKSRTLLFFDDHQNAVLRVKQAHARGFQHLIFDDNYPAGYGDCYSLNAAFANAGFSPKKVSGKQSLRGKLAAFLKPKPVAVQPNTEDSKFLHSAIDIFRVLPPFILLANHRLSDNWAENFPTPDPIYSSMEDLPHADIAKDHQYTWMCYVRLKQK